MYIHVIICVCMGKILSLSKRCYSKFWINITIVYSVLRSPQEVPVGLECVIISFLWGWGRWAMRNCTNVSLSLYVCVAHWGILCCKRYAVENVWGRVFLGLWRYIYTCICTAYCILLVRQCTLVFELSWSDGIYNFRTLQCEWTVVTHTQHTHIHTYVYTYSVHTYTSIHPSIHPSIHNIHVYWYCMFQNVYIHVHPYTSIHPSIHPSIKHVIHVHTCTYMYHMFQNVKLMLLYYTYMHLIFVSVIPCSVISTGAVRCAVFRWPLCWAWRFFRICSLEEEMACARLWVHPQK